MYLNVATQLTPLAREREASSKESCLAAEMLGAQMSGDVVITPAGKALFDTDSPDKSTTNERTSNTSIAATSIQPNVKVKPEAELSTEKDPNVKVCGEFVPFSKVTPPMLERMTDAERNEFFHLGQSLFEYVF